MVIIMDCGYNRIMAVISVNKLQKFYKVHQKEPGLAGSIRSLFHRKYYDVKAVDGVSF